MSTACDYKYSNADTSTSASATTNSTADRIEWSRTTILGFIEDYRRQRVLWDPNTKGYHIKQTKYEALKALGQKYGTEIRSIRSKIKSLRSSFHREHGKVINGRRKGIHYQPMWFAYEAIRFILDGETRGSGNGGERTTKHDSAAALLAGETESGAEEAEEKLSTIYDEGEATTTAAAAATTTAVVAGGGGGSVGTTKDYLLGAAAAAAATIDGIRAADELKVETATTTTTTRATKVLAATTMTTRKAATCAANKNAADIANVEADGGDDDDDDDDGADTDAVDDNDFVARVAAAAAAVMAAAAATTTPATALVTRSDFDNDLQTYCNISAEDVKTEIIESDFPTSAMVEIPRHTSTPSPLNYCKTQTTYEQTSNGRKRKTQMERYHDEHATTPKRQQQQLQLQQQQQQSTTHQHSNYHAHNRRSAGDLSTASCSSNQPTNKSTSSTTNNQSTQQSDEYGVFGEYVAITIRKLKTSKAKIVVKHLINNLLYEAELGKYDHGIPASKEPPQLYKM